ncbi:MAG: UDP-N-acetylglucosamine 1-carboxyvinyltransferase [Defluviitaleaceae bacterium]|nr:UDP-N-acetylglucosamine 1-carboxyvinyltransferase [Defluviitaleaceae bacterium]
MGRYRIQGGNRVAGELSVGGAKNSILPILAAVCLNKGESIIHNCPRIADTFLSIEILKHIGCRVVFSGNTLWINASGINEINIPNDYVKEMRSSILFMGAMLGRTGQVNIANPGGCDLGERSIGYHLDGLTAMGATIKHIDGTMHCTGSLKGANIYLQSASVGATENLMLAATLAKGPTTITNAAKEPEIVDLARFLKSMGADIRGAGTSKITVEGTSNLESATHEVMPDRIVAGTYLTAAAMTRGDINVTDISPKDLIVVTAKLTQMGCKISYGPTSIRLKAPERLKALEYLETSEHPGFPTDMQSQLVAALSIADGHSTVKERIFDNRHSHAVGLRLMGADVKTQQVIIGTDPKKEITLFDIHGKPELEGATVEAKDLRCGAALVLAGLAAGGETIVQNAKYVERGYENIEKALTEVGADIQLEEA